MPIIWSLSFDMSGLLFSSFICSISNLLIRSISYGGVTSWAGCIIFMPLSFVGGVFLRASLPWAFTCLGLPTFMLYERLIWLIRLYWNDEATLKEHPLFPLTLLLIASGSVSFWWIGVSSRVAPCSLMMLRPASFLWAKVSTYGRFCLCTVDL